MTEKFYKVYVQAVGEKSYCTNGLQFDKASKARDYGNDLLGRWTGASKFVVIRIDGPDLAPNRIDQTTAELIRV